MTRSELIEIISARFPHLPHSKSEEAVAEIIEKMTASMENGTRIEIRGFGSFNLSVRSPRKSRNPKTGESVPTPAKNIIRFKAGAPMRKAIMDSAAKTGIKQSN